MNCRVAYLLDTRPGILLISYIWYPGAEVWFKHLIMFTVNSVCQWGIRSKLCHSVFLVIWRLSSVAMKLFVSVSFFNDSVFEEWALSAFLEMPKPVFDLRRTLILMETPTMSRPVSCHLDGYSWILWPNWNGHWTTETIHENVGFKAFVPGRCRPSDVMGSHVKHKLSAVCKREALWLKGQGFATESGYTTSPWAIKQNRATITKTPQTFKS